MLLICTRDPGAPGGQLTCALAHVVESVQFSAAASNQPLSREGGGDGWGLKALLGPAPEGLFIEHLSDICSFIHSFAHSFIVTEQQQMT